MLWMAPYHALSVIQSFLLPKWLGGKIAVFTSSGSQKCELDERDASLRAPLHRRLKVIIWDCKAYMRLVYISFALIAVIRSTVIVLSDEQNQDTEKKFVQLLNARRLVITAVGFEYHILLDTHALCSLPA